MSDLKEYTITVQKMADELVKYVGGDFVVRNIHDTNDKKFGIPKLKKDGSTSVAYDQSLKVQVGDSITVAVDEKQKTNKDGNEYTVRTIRSISCDENGVPYMNQNKPSVPVKPQSGTGQQVNPPETAEARFRAIEMRLKALEDANQPDF